MSAVQQAPAGERDAPTGGHPERSRLPVLVCVDVEPDGRLLDRSRVQPWVGFEQVADLLEAARSGFAERTGQSATYTWFVRMDPQVAETQGSPTWPATAYAGRFARLRRAGDELGLHTHAYRSTADGGWIVDEVDQAWVEHTVRSAHAAFRESFQSTCRCFRFGDRWINDATLDVVEDLGIGYDVTLEPGRHPVVGPIRLAPTRGPSADFSSVPGLPYRRDPSDFRRPDPDGRSGLLLVPLSTHRYAPLVAAALTACRRIRHPTLRPEPVETLNLALRPALFRHVLARVLARPDVAHVALLVRSEPLAQRLGWIEHNLRILLEYPGLDRMVVTTVPEGMARLGLAGGRRSAPLDGPRVSRPAPPRNRPWSP